MSDLFLELKLNLSFNRVSVLLFEHYDQFSKYYAYVTVSAEPAEMSGPEVAKTPGGGAPGKEGKEPVANGHAGEGNDANPFAEYMWMENEEEYNRQVRAHTNVGTFYSSADFGG